MQAIAVSNTTGFGLTPPFNLKAFKTFFVSLKLPYSAQRGEQVSVIATVFNYGDQPERVWEKIARKIALNGTQHSTEEHRRAQNSTEQHRTAQNSTAQHSTAQHSTAQHSTAQHSTAQHSTAQHSTAQHSTARNTQTQNKRSKRA